MNILDQVEHLWTDHKKLVIAVSSNYGSFSNCIIERLYVKWHI